MPSCHKRTATPAKEGVLVCVCEREVGWGGCARVPKPDQKRILETIVLSELLGESRPRGVCAVGYRGGFVYWVVAVGSCLAE